MRSKVIFGDVIHVENESYMPTVGYAFQTGMHSSCTLHISFSRQFG